MAPAANDCISTFIAAVHRDIWDGDFTGFRMGCGVVLADGLHRALLEPAGHSQLDFLGFPSPMPMPLRIAVMSICSVGGRVGAIRLN